MAAIPFSVDDLTTVALDGDGVFDKLLKASTLHLKQEFDAQRIRGNDYATVYTALIGAAMQSAVQFALQKPITDQQAAKTALELELLAAQIRTEQANTMTLSDPPLPTDALIYKQKEILDQQREKLQEEIDLIIQKELTEKAQTNATAAGVIGAQINLYEEQVKGYQADRATKRAKIYADLAAVQLNTNDTWAGDNSALAGLTANDIKLAMDDMDTKAAAAG